MSRRRFMTEAEELSRRVPDIMFHAGEPALWALVLIEAGECPERQAMILNERLRDGDTNSPLRKFARQLKAAYSAQKEALKPPNSFRACREDALHAIEAANALGDEIVARSADCEERRRALAAALRDYYGMKELMDD